MALPFIAIGLAGVGTGAASERYGLPVPSINMLRGILTPSNAQIEAQAYSIARQELIAKEGYRDTAYLDSLGRLTVGIGHLVLPADNIKLGQKISAAQVDAFFKKDIEKAFNSAKSQAKELNKYNAQMIAALTSVNFQLGSFWRVKFPNTWAHLKNGNAKAAIANINKSLWMKQTPVRAIAFVNTVKQQYGVA